jgi:hypothetical protein
VRKQNLGPKATGETSLGKRSPAKNTSSRTPAKKESGVSAGTQATTLDPTLTMFVRCHHRRHVPRTQAPHLKIDHRARNPPAATSYCTGPNRHHAAHHSPDSSAPPAHRADHPSRPTSARRIFAQTGSAGGACAPRAFCCRYKTKRARSARSTLSCYRFPCINPSRPTSASTHQSRC